MCNSKKVQNVLNKTLDMILWRVCVKTCLGIRKGEILPSTKLWMLDCSWLRFSLKTEPLLTKLIKSMEIVFIDCWKTFNVFESENVISFFCAVFCLITFIKFDVLLSIRFMKEEKCEPCWCNTFAICLDRQICMQMIPLYTLV